jgi:phospholipase/lecithinase/hemolysin
MKNYRLWSLLILTTLATLLTACGAGSIKDPFVPSRIVVFGDNMSVRTAGARYTVNGSGGLDNWSDQVASNYGVTNIVAKAQPEALVSGVDAQIAAHGATYLESDLILVTAGFRDIINLAQTPGANTNAARALGQSYGEAIRRAVNNGAKKVLPLNMYDFSKQYGALTTKVSSEALMKSLIRAFNDGLKINLESPYVGDNVRLIDAEFYMNLVINAPASYGFSDSKTVVCSITDPGAGIGLGAGQRNASLCNTGNVDSVFTSTYDSYVYADSVYLTPAVHRSVGRYAHTGAAQRW